MTNNNYFKFVKSSLTYMHCPVQFACFLASHLHHLIQTGKTNKQINKNKSRSGQVTHENTQTL